mmetsp:Transcript_1358/g.2467  ORF Transcript_1358/g.2467 Transcript_1358/m.2467 type:complete len:87 (-) Transcript_1358:40-300(-)
MGAAAPIDLQNLQIGRCDHAVMRWPMAEVAALSTSIFIGGREDLREAARVKAANAKPCSPRELIYAGGREAARHFKIFDSPARSTS